MKLNFEDLTIPNWEGIKGLSGQQYTGNTSDGKIVFLMPSCGPLHSSRNIIVRRCIAIITGYRLQLTKQKHTWAKSLALCSFQSSGSRRSQIVSKLQRCGDDWNTAHSSATERKYHRDETRALNVYTDNTDRSKQTTPLCSEWTQFTKVIHLPLTGTPKDTHALCEGSGCSAQM